MRANGEAKAKKMARLKGSEENGVNSRPEGSSVARSASRPSHQIARLVQEPVFSPPLCDIQGVSDDP